MNSCETVFMPGSELAGSMLSQEDQGCPMIWAACLDRSQNQDRAGLRASCLQLSPKAFQLLFCLSCLVLLTMHGCNCAVRLKVDYLAAWEAIP